MNQIAAKIPVVIGALGLIKKGLQKYVQRIPGNIKIHELQLQMGGSRYLEHLIYCMLTRKTPIHRTEFYLILTLGPRNGLSCYVVLLHKVKGGNHNNSYYFTELDFFVFTFFLFIIPTDIEQNLCIIQNPSWDVICILSHRTFLCYFLFIRIVIN